MRPTAEVILHIASMFSQSLNDPRIISGFSEYYAQYLHAVFILVAEI